MKLVLIDDEQLALDYLQRLVKKLDNLEIIGAFSDAETAKAFILQNNVDAIFLDINLSGENGIEIAEQIAEKKPQVPIVFVTAYDEYAIRAFEVNAIDYILKPIQLDRLKMTIERIYNTVKPMHVKVENKPLKVNLFGNLSFEIHDGKKIMQWRTKKVLELFLYLIHKRNELVEKSTLVELLWPDMEYKRAFHQLYTAIYHIRKKLVKYNSYFELNSVADGYVLKTANIIVDVEHWEQQLSKLPPVCVNNIHLYEEVMELYKAPLLEYYNYVWLESRKQYFERIWVKTAFEIAETYVESSILPDAKRWYLKICQFSPLEDEAHYALMRIYAEENDSINVHQQYITLRNLLKEELDLLPNQKITNWYHNWAKKI
ncbi:response regulator [Pontibacillus litoralis]|uniref:Response regulatory domain-containing protein n=1 Tax=Pontibacillus litoralis JSM 072002 TaxID=1385512 RepID=A0A0A5HM86_9BACI|nr:response regulator [Pontibacillus litoralis]KGX84742.1 hypothetical protein N784_12065 [Pontibacillus litoralis JSM 072002]